MKLTILGTGHAIVTKCYNTCFTLSENGKHLLVDAGGGSGILVQLEKASIKITDIHEVFVTHKHIDHLLGVIWMLRLFTHLMRKGQYEGDAYIYSHAEVIRLLRQFGEELLQPGEVAMFDKRLHFVEVQDGETGTLLGHKTTFFDIHSTKAKQFGFVMEYAAGKKLACCGDEPYQECEYAYVKNSTWLLHEAFNLDSEDYKYNSHSMHHGTVKEACENAAKLNVKNIVIYHTEDDNIYNRRKLYTAEGQKYFQGNIYVPEDLEVIDL